VIIEGVAFEEFLLSYGGLNCVAQFKKKTKWESGSKAMNLKIFFRFG
jgi:hypothetical protein